MKGITAAAIARPTTALTRYSKLLRAASLRRSSTAGVANEGWPRSTPRTCATILPASARSTSVGQSARSLPSAARLHSTASSAAASAPRAVHIP